MSEQKETMARVYMDAQKSCGLKVGDYVKVLRKAENNEAGWGCYWNEDDMDILVGKTGKVLGLYEDGCGIEVEIENGSHRYPYFVLEKVDKPAPVFKPFDPVLVRDAEHLTWYPDVFLWEDERNPVNRYKCCRSSFAYCIPYAGNEHLCGTTDSPEE